MIPQKDKAAKLRMGSRIGADGNKIFPQILELIQNCSIKKESYESINNFFRQNSISSFPENEHVLDLLVSYINNGDPSICRHGAICIFYVLCQKTFEFQPEFTSKLCENLSHLFGCEDPIVFYFFFKILYYISKISQDYAQEIKQMVSLDMLKTVILTSANQKVIFAAMKFFKIYFITDINSKEVYTTLCEISCELIKSNLANTKVLIETVKLCYNYAQKTECWATFFQPYQLFDAILSLLDIDEDLLKLYILKLISNYFKNTQTIDNINFQDIIPLINHNNPNVQKAAIWCIIKCLFRFQNYLPKFLEMELLENSFNCIQNGSFKARVACIPIFDRIIVIDESVISVYLDNKLLSILFELIPEVQDGFELDKIFHIIKNMIRYVEKLRQKEAYQELVNQFMEANFEEVYEEFIERSRSVTNKLSKEELGFYLLTESFQLIMRDVNNMGSNLESA